jgi:lysophospholipase L1-like esterase
MLFHVCKEVRMVPYLPLFELTQGDAVWRREAAQGDGIHPNREGYALVAEAVLNWPAWQKWV